MYDSTISVVIPVYNGKAMMDELVGRLSKVLSEFKDYEIILVDDSSPDGGFEKIRELAAGSEHIKGIALDGNYGQQSAVLCGIRQSSMDHVVIMDDDLEHNPEDIPALYEELQKGYDVVYALNAERGDNTLVRRLGSRLRDYTFNRLSSKPRDKKVCSYRILTRETSDAVSRAGMSFVYISMEILKYTGNVGNIYVRYGKRGRSGHSMVKLIKLMLKLNLYYSKSRMFGKIKASGKQYGIKETAGKGAL